MWSQRAIRWPFLFYRPSVLGRCLTGATLARPDAVDKDFRERTPSLIEKSRSRRHSIELRFRDCRDLALPCFDFPPLGER
jgi:hypothetical protein